MTAEGGHNYGSLSEAVQQPVPKPGLGPPHDTRATVVLTLGLAAALLFQGRVNVEGGWMSWAGWLTAWATIAVGIYYFQRAYGFSSHGWGRAPMGAVTTAIFGLMVTGSFVAPGIYSQMEGSTLGLIASFMAIAMLAMGTLRAALGPAGTQRGPDSNADSNPTRYQHHAEQS